ncbi:MAG: hypothetical protein DWQ10_13375, partial [Calditrichaeota bacterium]
MNSIKKYCVLLLLMLNTLLYAQNKLDPALQGFTQSSLKKQSVGQEIVVLLKADAAIKHDLEARGVKVRTVIGDQYLVASVPADKLSSLVEMKSIDYIAASKQMKLLNNIACCVSGGIEAGKAGFTGDDVLIGIVDSGIDVSHSGFHKKNGDTRVLYLWDQTEKIDGKQPTVSQYGTEWTAEDIDAGICTSRDTQGHGTHVAGCAAQYYHDGDSTYSGGVKSNLIVVKTNLGGIEILEGVNYIFKKAEELGKPCIVNLSLGGHEGPHDGTDPLTAAMDLLTGPGKIILRASGNEGGKNIHAQTNADSDGEALVFTVKEFADSLKFDCWYDGSAAISVRTIVPGDFTHQIIETGMAGTINFDNELFIEYSNGYGGVESYNGDYNLRIIFRGNIHPGQYSLEFFSDQSQPIHAWMYDANPLESFEFENTDDHYTIVNDACGRNVIVVGAAVTKNEFEALDENGNTVTYQTGEQLATVAAFSSAGPTRDGRQKPDMVMPGSYVAASVPHNIVHQYTERLFSEGAFYTIPGTTNPMANWAGTSFSVANATGAIAQGIVSPKINNDDEWLDPHDVSTRLKNICQPLPQMMDYCPKPGGAAEPVWDYRAGWGYLDLRNVIGEEFASIQCREAAETQIEVVFSDPVYVIDDATKYTITGASAAQIIAAQPDGNSILLTLDNILKKGYRDTLVIETGGLFRNEYVPIEKPGTIIELSSLFTPTSWEIDGSPYYVHGQLQIPSGVKLEMQTGTNVEFIANPHDEKSGLLVFGTLDIKGDSTNPVQLLPYSGEANLSWDGINLQGSHANANIEHCVIENAKTGILCWESNLTLQNSRVSNASEIGVLVHNSAPIIRKTVINNTGGTSQSAGIWIQGINQTLQMEHLTITQNDPFGIILLGDQSLELDYCIFSNNKIALQNQINTPSSVRYSDFWQNNTKFSGNFQETSNFVADPLFVNVENNDFRLQEESPCGDYFGSFVGAFPAVVPPPPVIIPTIYINEFMASNDAYLADPDEDTDDGDPYEDWVELYNPDTAAVDVGGLYITDDFGELTMWQIPTSDPAKTTIPGGGFLLLYADKETHQGILHIDIKLSGSGEQIALVAADGETVIDSLRFSEQLADVSFARLPDGSPDWYFFPISSPGESNTTGDTTRIINSNEETKLPTSFSLAQNYPNPFGFAKTAKTAAFNATTIDYALPQNAHVYINVFDIPGKEIAKLVNA